MQLQLGTDLCFWLQASFLWKMIIICFLWRKASLVASICTCNHEYGEKKPSNLQATALSLCLNCFDWQSSCDSQAPPLQSEIGICTECCIQQSWRICHGFLNVCTRALNLFDVTKLWAIYSIFHTKKIVSKIQLTVTEHSHAVQSSYSNAEYVCQLISKGSGELCDSTGSPMY